MLWLTVALVLPEGEKTVVRMFAQQLLGGGEAGRTSPVWVDADRPEWAF